MRSLLKITLFIFLAELLLSVITPLTYPGAYQLYAYVLHCLIFGLFYFGYKSRKRITSPITSNRGQKQSEEKVKLRSLWLLTLITFIFVSLYINFYTGNSILTVFSSLLLNQTGAESLYYTYQRHFAENQLATFSLEKLPYIIIYPILKLGFYCVTLHLISHRQMSKKVVIPVTILFLLFLTIGLARGTSLELFELACFLMFCVVFAFQKNPDKKSRRKLVLLSLLPILAYLLFDHFKAMRYEDGIIVTSTEGETFVLDQDSFLANNFPWLFNVLRSLSSYFMFGFYYISHCFNDLWLQSIEGFISLLVPMGTPIFFSPDNTKELLDGTYINFGVRWVPDIVLWIERFGLIFSLTFIYLLGKFTHVLDDKFRKSDNTIYVCMLFFILVQMASFSVGNFISSSSSNILMVILCVFLVFNPSWYRRLERMFFS